MCRFRSHDYVHNSIGYSHERPLLLPPPGRWAPDRAFGGCEQAGVRGGPTQGHFPRSVARPVKALSHRGPLSTCARLQGPKEPLVLKRGRKGRGSRHAASSAVAVGGSTQTECRWPRRTQRGPAAVPAAGRGALSRLVAPGPTRAPTTHVLTPDTNKGTVASLCHVRRAFGDVSFLPGQRWNSISRLPPTAPNPVPRICRPTTSAHEVTSAWTTAVHPPATRRRAAGAGSSRRRPRISASAPVTPRACVCRGVHGGPCASSHTRPLRPLRE